MSTTDILFNSPALHSLKRAQLVQLCKRHNVKASGKNTELVARLKEHARGLPSNTPLSVAVRSESFGDGSVATDISDEDDIEEQLTSPDKERPSQVWEIVSGDVSEPREEAQQRGSIDSKRSAGTRSQASEFGSIASSKSTIFRSLASSIGLKRSSSTNSNLTAGESSDSLGPTTYKKDKDSMKRGSSGSPKPRSAFSSLLSRSRSNSHESQSKAGTRDSLITHAIPYNEIPVPSVSRRPHVEPFAFSYAGAEDTSLASDVSMASIDRPVPGVGPCSSVNASESDGTGTIRLITSTNNPPEDEDAPKLTPVIPAFDLVPPTPGNTGLHRWPMSTTPEANRSLYPTLNSDDMNMDLDVLTSPSKDPSKGKDKSLPALPPRELSPTPKEPFVFGSPNPRHSTAATDFSHAASSVLAEMNARLGAAGGRAIGADVLVHAPRTKLAVDELLKYEFGGARANKEGEGTGTRGEGSMSSKFDRAHEKVFSRMEGIDTHYAAKRGMKDKEQKGKEKEKLEPLPDNRKRKQSTLDVAKASVPAAAKNKSAGVRVISNGARKKMAGGVAIPGAFEDDDMTVEELVSSVEAGEQDEDEEHERGAKRACVTKPTADGSGETRRVSIAPKVRKGISEDEDDMDEEKKRKQNEAVKRRLELNKARRRSSRGRPSVGPRTPGQKQKTARFGFLASAKSLVKAVWNRGGTSATSKTKPVPTVQTRNTSAQTPATGPSYTKATASSSSKSLEQEAKPVPAIGAKPPTSRVSVVRSTSIGSGGLRPKASTSQSRSASGSGLDTVTEGEKAPVTSVPQPQNPQASGPVPESTLPRKPSTLASVVRNPSGSGAPAAAVGRSSRLLAPTASSLAKVNASPTKAAATSSTNTNGILQRSKIPSARARASIISPSKIPVFSPPNRKNQSIVPGSGIGKSIFGSPLVLPSSPQARFAAEKGHDINPITGAISPQRRMPFSNANGQTQSLMGAASGFAVKAGVDEAKGQNEPVQTNNGLGVLRKPRISRSKVIARLGAHRERNERTASNTASPRVPRSPAKASVRSGMGASGSGVGNKGPATPKVRSSAGIAARRSLGGPKTRDSGASGVIMSAKKRARATEYARRRSVKAPGPDFTKGADSMDVDG